MLHRKETAENAFFEASAKHNDVVLLIHDTDGACREADPVTVCNWDAENHKKMQLHRTLESQLPSRARSQLPSRWALDQGFLLVQPLCMVPIV